MDRETDRDAAPEGDAALMARVAAGDRAAFRDLYETHAPAVMRLLHRLCGDRSMAEDLTQEVFVKAWRAAPRWRPDAGVRAWLLTVARRHGWNEAAKRSRRRRVWGGGVDPAGRVAPAREPGEAAERAEEAARLESAVLSLSPRLRLVFVLVRLEGLALDEAARIAGVPVGTVKSRLAAAEARLRRRLRGGT